MAECSFARCVQERRLIKKELQRWTKNMVFVVGLERVAEELMGRRKWKQCQNVLSSCQAAETLLESSTTARNNNNNVADDDEIKDWKPQDKCCLCNEETFLDRVPSPGSDTGSTSNDSIYREPSPLSRLPSTPPPPTPAMTTFESVKLAAIAALSHSPDNPPAMPANMFYPPSHGGLFSPWYLTPTLPPHLAGRPAPDGHRMEPAPVMKEVVNGPEMPLDLSAKALTTQAPPPQSLRVPSMENKQIFKAKPRMSAVAGRRTYTEDELQAALRDIQSGKLGTRRAAVIYGIPRSTLRNKVYKLAMERERDAQMLLNAPPPPQGKPDEDDKELSGAEEEREVEKALRKPLLSMEDLVRFSMLEQNGLSPEAIKSLLQQGKLDGSFPFPSGDVWGGLEHSALGPYISQLLAAGKTQEGAEQAEFRPKFAPPLLPELVRRMMVEEKLLMDEHVKRAHNGADESRPGSSGLAQKDEETSDAEAAPSNVILKIPSFRPTSKNGTVPEPFPSPSESSSQPFNGDSRSPPSLVGKGIGVSLRDVIAKSISQKFQQGGELGPLSLSQKLLMSPEVEPMFKRSRFSPPLNHISVHAAMKHNNNNNHMDDRNAQKMSPSSKSSSMMSQSNSGGSGGKGTRPKRGKYRNYDRDSLVEAVRAVQRGEMSVHRAGSYYGVPHSTLEYKVKERHLMRPRKRDSKSMMDEPKRKEDLRLSSPHDSPTLGPPKMCKPPYPTSPLQNPPNGLKIPPMFDPSISPLAYSTPPPFPFWPPNPFHNLPMPDYARGPNPHEQFMASQMMQQLQEESSRLPRRPIHSSPVVTEPPLGTSARKIAESLYDGTGTNGNFLDGIIRSSLEMGLPSGASKERTVKTPENLSNKALLDQLCRNSRLTPLPIQDGSTSEDEDSVKRSSNFGKGDGSERHMDFSPSSDDSGRQRKRADNMDEDNYYTKSQKDNFSDNDSPSKDSNDDYSDNDDPNEDESACDSKNILRKRVEVEDDDDDDAAKDIADGEKEEEDREVTVVKKEKDDNDIEKPNQTPNPTDQH